MPVCILLSQTSSPNRDYRCSPKGDCKCVFDLAKDFGTSQSIKIDSIFDSLLCPDRPAYVTIPYCTSTASCS
ncbi:MAG: hypothetical protein KZQ66_07940, partial [Candidatus Thiodiazotropha sp. (ex Lucinoma aequizonata)]|nr:hypothetical protein [Candidatus Thiodiazotropha sp. (ex Lucinoma aequizonata)]MCU7896984.1 hypothetical protein [Candidatus Thiodiazotropha sp. (ex Lucinoma aequizonata)]MCU7901929.1 hypothetical protein [Candidatus Thiodiazotropha sp. (ex Lucinoma aequizonata)]